ncbi:MAG: copper chaperone PCu(A)C [Pseudomonadota bacterium]
MLKPHLRPIIGGMQSLLLLTLLLVGITVSADESAGAPLSVENGWVRLPPPASRMTAGYLKLTNLGTDPVDVIGAASPRFDQVSLHETHLVDGVFRMRSVKTLTLEPGETRTLEPGGLHLMLMRPVSDLRQGEKIEVLLKLDGADPVPVSLTVEKR